MKPQLEDNEAINIYTCLFLSPLGTMLGAANSKGIVLVSFYETGLEKYIDKKQSQQFQIITEQNGNRHLKELKIQLDEYFDGKRRWFELTLNPAGTPFQQKVWSELHNIPYGETRSYQQQTNTLGDPKAIRAVASANGKNPIAIIIPCHRIIGSDGSSTGYAGGLWRKKWLLEHEAKHSGHSYQSELGL
ncbi:MAG: methylated-DNA--[protein]-cysteine S-methyltransferase [Salinivirgaceae bacterium]